MTGAQDCEIVLYDSVSKPNYRAVVRCSGGPAVELHYAIHSLFFYSYTCMKGS